MRSPPNGRRTTTYEAADPARPGSTPGGVAPALIAAAAHACMAHGGKLTAVRRRVLELMIECNVPIKAYDLLRVLAEEGHNPAPPTVYRALTFLERLGVIQRVRSLKAYRVCDRPGEGVVSALLICDACGLVEEVFASQASALIKANARKQHFTLHEQKLELHGYCGGCARR